jgi:DNA anti-recombination protein RmuC
VGRQLDSAVGAYNEAIGSFDHRVVPQVRRIEDAGAASERAVQAPAALEGKARQSAARLAGGEPPPADDHGAGVAELPRTLGDDGPVEAAA